MKKYRELLNGEVILAGDEIKNGAGQWCMVSAMIGMVWHSGFLIKSQIRRIVEVEEEVEEE